MVTPRPRSGLEDVKLGQALLKHRLLTATQLLGLTGEVKQAGVSLREYLQRTGRFPAPLLEDLLAGRGPSPAAEPVARAVEPAGPPAAATTLAPAPVGRARAVDPGTRPPVSVVLPAPAVREPAPPPPPTTVPQTPRLAVPEEPALARREQAFAPDRATLALDALFGPDPAAPTTTPSVPKAEPRATAPTEATILDFRPPATESALDQAFGFEDVSEPPIPSPPPAAPEPAAVLPPPAMPLPSVPSTTVPPPAAPVSAIEPFVIGEHFQCLHLLESTPELKRYEVLRTTDQQLGRLTLLDARASRGPQGAAVKACAEMMEDVRNPCCQGILGHGDWQGQCYWVEEAISGSPLPEFLRAGPMPARSTASIVADIAEALAETHGLGLAHQALTAHSIVITPSGRPRLLGFCRADRTVASTAGHAAPAADVRKDLSDLLDILRTMIDGGGKAAPAGRGGMPAGLSPADPLERALGQLYALASSSSPAARYESAERLAHDLREAIGGESIYPPGSSHAWRMLATLARWVRFSWLVGFFVAAAVVGIFGAEQVRKWRDLQAATSVDTSILALQSEMEPSIKRGRELLERGRQALWAGRIPEATQDLRDAVKDFGTAIQVAPARFFAHPAYVGRAEAHLLLGSYPAGVLDCEAALGVQPNEGYANYLRAVLLLAEHHARLTWTAEGRGRNRVLRRSAYSASDSLEREAVRSLESCAPAPGTVGEGYRANAAALLAYLRERGNAVLPALRATCAREPQHRVAHEALAFALTAQAPIDADAALGAASHVIAHTPDAVRILALRAEIHLLKDNATRAQEDIADAIRRSPAEGWLHEIQARVKIARGFPAQALQDLAQAIRLTGDLAAAYRTRGNLLRTQGRWDDALADLSRAAELAPGSVEPRLARAGVLEDMLRWEDAAAEYGRAAAADRTREEAWVGQIRSTLARGDEASAANLVQQGMDVHSHVAALALALGICRLGQKDTRAAIRALDKALELVRAETHLEPEEVVPRPGEARAGASDWGAMVRYPCPVSGIHYVRALCQLAASAPDLAERDLNAALEADRDFLPALRERCTLLLTQGKTRAALLDARQLVGLLPQQPAMLVLRARVLERRGDYLGAKADLDAALTMAPEDADAVLARGRVQSLRGDHEAALKDYDRAILLRPQSARAWAWRASAEAARMNVRRAREDYETALSLDPALADAHLGLARLAAEGGRPRDAVTLLDRALKATPEQPDLLALRAGLHVKLGQLDLALADYQTAVALQPDNAALVCNRGVALQSQGRLEEALADYTRAIEVDRQFAPALLNRGLLYLDAHRLEESRRDFDRALEIRPDYHEPLMARARSWQEAGQTEQALRDYSAAIDCRPNNGTAYLNRALLLVRLGQDQRAREDVKRALRLDPSLQNAIAPELRQILDRR